MVCRAIFMGLRCCWWLVLFASVPRLHAGAAPVVLITNLPPFGATADLAGRVLNANPATQAVAVFIFVPGYGWVTKPTCAQPLSALRPDGSWRADIITASGDTAATRVAAFLVGTNFNQPCALGLPKLPTNLYAQASASAIVTRPSPGVRWLRFSGYDWWVKSSASRVGPGPNYFSDSASNVWTDAQGWLHLRITHRSNAWQCAEIISARTFGFGSYRFELNSAADALDPNATLGLFTWSDDPAFAHREIDVEGARWGNPADANNAQFVVQPYGPAGHLVRYRVPAGMTNSMHLFTWETDRVSFQALAGAYTPKPAASNVIATWVFTNAAAVPQSGDENVRLNLWLCNGNALANGGEVEVVVKSLQFAPLGAPPPATLRGPGSSGKASFQFDLGTAPDFRYQVQRSSDLAVWPDLAVLLATNDAAPFQDTNAAASGGRFYRAVTLP
jgi:hypothetical protein